ncbi:MAG TPA: AfsR/SARP family transcriptional regulator [Actinomycetes bacterium]|jgi:DNA-binding SARP family transcriptional activator|nr:AfsR/SARP family transcriptional regulator [Actinomycetes bacterium]
MRFRVLGHLGVVGDDGAVVSIPGAKERALLSVLLVHAGEVVSADRLIDALWGEDLPGNPQNALQHHASQLRKALGRKGLVVGRKPGYLLEVGADSVDAWRFEQLLRDGQTVLAEDPAMAFSLLTEALSLWRGTALADFAYDDFAQQEAARLEELHLEAIEARTQAGLALGRQAELVGELEVLAAANPLRERLRGQQMLALYRSGRQADALRVYQETREALTEQLGLDPSPELQALYQAILQQDASIAPVRTAPRRPRHNLPGPRDELRWT